MGPISWQQSRGHHRADYQVTQQSPDVPWKMDTIIPKRCKLPWVIGQRSLQMSRRSVQKSALWRKASWMPVRGISKLTSRGEALCTHSLLEACHGVTAGNHSEYLVSACLCESQRTLHSLISGNPPFYTESACICLKNQFGPEAEPLGIGLMLVPCTDRLLVCGALSNKRHSFFRWVA